MSAIAHGGPSMAALLAPLSSVGEGRTSRLALQVAALMLALAAPTLAAAALDGRTILEVGVWVKPLKFQVSLALHFATLAVLLALVEPRVRDGRWVFAAMGVAGVAAIGEIAWIMVQAMRGRASHFNVETTLEANAYAVMGLGALMLVAIAAVVAIAIARAGRKDAGRGLKAGAILGLSLGAVATLIVAGFMSNAGSHAVGGLPGGPGLPLVGWSTVVGDLRVPHFLATHAMQVIPLVGLMADRWRPNAAVRAVRSAAVALMLLIGLTFAQALAGLPLLPLG